MEIPSQVYQESIYRMSGAHRGTVQRCPVTDMGEQESFRAIVSHKNFEEKKKKSVLNIVSLVQFYYIVQKWHILFVFNFHLT